MNILLIEFRDITHPEAGGAEVVLQQVFRRIVAAGHRVDYLCNHYPGAAREEVRDGIRIVRRGRQPFFNFWVPWVYRRELRQNNYDVIVEGIDKVPFNMPWFERRVPVACIVPHLFGTTVFREAAWPVAAYVYMLERSIPRAYRQSLFSVLAQSTKDDLVGRGIPPEHVQVIRSGLTQADYSAPETKPPSDHPTILYVGRLKRYKGIELGFEAVQRLRAKYPKIEYAIVGVGDYLPRLQDKVRMLGLENNVSFRGFVTHAEKVALMQQAAVLIYTSPKEGWGLSVIEANACGTPVVASAAPGLRESVKHGETGFLVPHGDVDALTQRLGQLLSDPVLYAALRRNGIAWAQTFTWERATTETLALLEQARRDFQPTAQT
ncbi:MAG: glycosyltransferase family 1 protein [Verrucomicrobia bacterium]|nr:MAG: glycosyltransferase family 1 protein [Verrucomicrobiota bacterium]